MSSHAFAIVFALMILNYGVVLVALVYAREARADVRTMRRQFGNTGATSYAAWYGPDPADHDGT